MFEIECSDQQFSAPHPGPVPSPVADREKRGQAAISSSPHLIQHGEDRGDNVDESLLFQFWHGVNQMAAMWSWHCYRRKIKA